MKTPSTLSVAFGLLLLPLQALAIGQYQCVYFSNSSDSLFPLVSGGQAAPIITSDDEWPGVLRVANDFRNDICNVTFVMPETMTVSASSISGIPTTAILVGTLGHSALIDAMVNYTGMDVSSLQGQWEAYSAHMMMNPLPGVDMAYVIMGSDKRGTIYGMYELSEQMGVSPWYYWADVPIKTNSEVYAATCEHGSPSVKYRAIFFNDEQPALESWAQYTFTNGTGPPFNHYFYSHVFELLLRLKANSLLPAMWTGMFGVDDPMNQPLADYYGIVMTSSHEEPLMRSTPNEWNAFYPGQAWDFSSNAANLTAYWTAGAERAKPYEGVYTVGMRGAGDLPMGPSTNIALLESVIADQRQILASVFEESDVSNIPQAWWLCKPIFQPVKCNILISLKTRNFGNIRRLPYGNETARSGGWGVYFHIDYVGSPRDFKWITSSQMSKTYEQMHLAYTRGADRLWIINVGDLKPYEMNTEYFLNYGYDVTRWNQTNLDEFSSLWAEREFAMPEHTDHIVSIINNVTMYNSRRKPELVNATTYTSINYGEADNILAAYAAMNETSTMIYNSVPQNMQAAYFQLVHHPLLASYTMQKMYIFAGMNNLYAGQARYMTNYLADQVAALFEADYDLEYEYNHLLDGKWMHMMDQTVHVYWQQTMQNVMPAVNRVPTRKVSIAGAMRVMIEGSMGAWPGDDMYDCAQGYSCPTAYMMALDPYGPASRWADVGAGGPIPFSWTATSNVSWLTISPSSGYIDPSNPSTTEQRVYMSVNWADANIPDGGQGFALINFNSTSTSSYLQREALSTQVVPFVFVANMTGAPANFSGFVEGDGSVTMEAEHATRNTTVDGTTWTIIPNYGRTLSGVTPFPPNGGNYTPGTGPSLCVLLRSEYDVYIFNTMEGNVTVNTYVSPSLNNNPTRPLGYAVQWDDSAPVPIYFIPYAPASTMPAGWDTPDGFAANAIVSTATNFTTAPGAHTLKVWQIEPAVILQRIVINTGNVRPSYLGPPESIQL
ncbi:glycoside hydrolase family 115 protein [Calocera cornea HHB12733]|uniref:Glycoside hydrolase family 115 protein n=1 Tax=Calocera cornea HHB12733 TaxID=1353952 RepID=A0A165IYH0_9BASI|nr:glycoside hydrolase family 115 protein [Calocera cornea HHB12733]